MTSTVDNKLTVTRPKTTVDPDGQGGKGGWKHRGGAEFNGKGTFADLFHLQFYHDSDYSRPIGEHGIIYVGQPVYFRAYMDSPSKVNPF